MIPLPVLAIASFASAQIQPQPVPQTYYVSSQGNDANAGTSPATAWRTLAKVTAWDQSAGFVPGDTILLERGNVWDEGAPLTLHSDGTAAAKITLGEYGSAATHARISRRSSLHATCAVITGDYWLVKDVRFESAHLGIEFSAIHNHSGRGAEVVGASFYDIDDRTDDQDPSRGITFDVWGWQDVSVRCCVFDRVTNGITTPVGTYVNNIVIDQCEAYGGWGPGFALQNVIGGRVSNFNVHDVGGHARDGTCGGFLVSCTSVVVDNCSFARVAHGGGNDGVGFDFESNNTNCALTNCFLFDNEGAAILMFSGGGVPNNGILIADCLFYNNNRVLHGSHDADCVLHLATVNNLISTGSMSNCGIYKNSNSADYLGGRWTGFVQTGNLNAPQCDGWVPVYGNFLHLAVGNHGHICAVGSDRKIYEWTGRLTGNAWNLIGGPGQVDTASVGNDGELWATDINHAVWRHLGGGNWAHMPGLMTKVAVGSAANIWAINRSGSAGGPVYQWSAPLAQWIVRHSSMTDVDAGPRADDAWGLVGTSALRYDFGWQSVPNVSLTQVSVHSDDNLGNRIAAGVNGTTILRTIDGVRFDTLPGKLVEVSEGSDGTLWGLDVNHYVWRAR